MRTSVSSRAALGRKVRAIEHLRHSAQDLGEGIVFLSHRMAAADSTLNATKLAEKAKTQQLHCTEYGSKETSRSQSKSDSGRAFCVAEFVEV